MDSSVGVTLRLLVLTVVVIGMPLLAVPRGRPAPTIEHHANSGSRRPPRPTGAMEWRATGRHSAARSDSPGTPTPPVARASGRTTPSSGNGVPSMAGFSGGESERGERVELTLSSSLQRRLEELGAEYLMVERLEVSGLYRCVCLVNVPDTTYQRPFEAADLRPEQAVQRVLDELESWRLAASGLHDPAPH